MVNNTQSIISDILLPNLPITGPTKIIGEYCPIKVKEANVSRNKMNELQI